MSEHIIEVKVITNFKKCGSECHFLKEDSDEVRNYFICTKYEHDHFLQGLYPSRSNKYYSQTNYTACKRCDECIKEFGE